MTGGEREREKSLFCFFVLVFFFCLFVFFFFVCFFLFFFFCFLLWHKSPGTCTGILQYLGLDGGGGGGRREIDIS